PQRIVAQADVLVVADEEWPHRRRRAPDREVRTILAPGLRLPGSAPALDRVGRETTTSTRHGSATQLLGSASNGTRRRGACVDRIVTVLFQSVRWREKTLPYTSV